MNKAQETVYAILATLPTVNRYRSVFWSDEGAALIDTGMTVIYVSAEGNTSETPTEWNTGWDA